MEKLKAIRELKRTDATKSVNRITPTILTSLEKLENIAYLQGLLTDLKDLDTKILNHMIETKVDEKKITAEYDKSSEYQHKLLICITSMQSSLSSASTASAALTSENNVSSDPRNLNKLKLPQIKLPKYGHREGENLSKFFQNFEQIINKYPLTEYEKFAYLEGQLYDDALTVVKSLETANQTYTAAKELLQEAFASTVTLQFEAIKRLISLKFVQGDSQYVYVGKLRTIIEAIRTLKIDSEIFMQYFIWTGMDINLKAQFAHITNSNKPTLKEIEKYIFRALERYETFNENFKDSLESDCEISSAPSNPIEFSDPVQSVSVNLRHSPNHDDVPSMSSDELSDAIDSVSVNLRQSPGSSAVERMDPE